MSQATNSLQHLVDLQGEPLQWRESSILFPNTSKRLCDWHMVGRPYTLTAIIGFVAWQAKRRSVVIPQASFRSSHSSNDYCFPSRKIDPAISTSTLTRLENGRTWPCNRYDYQCQSCDLSPRMGLKVQGINLQERSASLIFWNAS